MIRNLIRLIRGRWLVRVDLPPMQHTIIVIPEGKGDPPQNWEALGWTIVRASAGDRVVFDIPPARGEVA